MTDENFISETIPSENLSTSAIDKRATSSGTTPPPQYQGRGPQDISLSRRTRVEIRKWNGEWLDSVVWQGILKSRRPGGHQDLGEPCREWDHVYSNPGRGLVVPVGTKNSPTPGVCYSILQGETKLVPPWLETGPDNAQLPPPAEFPLRPRASEYLKVISDVACRKRSKFPDRVPHTITGPPFHSLSTILARFPRFRT